MECPACREKLIDPQVCFFCGETVHELKKAQFRGKVALWCLIGIAAIVLYCIMGGPR